MKTADKSVYFDNASTSFPKAPGVGHAMAEYLDTRGCNVGRGNYKWGYEVAETVYKTRKKLCKLFQFNQGSDPSKNVIFTSSVTEGLNLVIKGLLKPGDHVLVSSMEHNAVMRPLYFLEQQGIAISVMPCDIQGKLQLDKIEPLIQKNTKAIIMTHGSNVCGSVLPIEKVAEICGKHQLKFVVDSAQTAGIFPINMAETSIDGLCFTGHKGLLGPQGIGGVIMKDDLAEQITSLVQGGTGSRSESFEMPDFLPDKFESGTLNIPGIYGLSKALDYLQEKGLGSILNMEMELTQRLISGIQSIENLDLIGIPDINNRSAVVSIVSVKKDNAQVAFELDQSYGIMTRVGLHCAPLAHKTLGTYPQGTIRLSLGHFNTSEEVDYCLNALNEITK
ncbi:aminotransferase class V-fold PLP-dependent enzyme [Acetobacterium paludosum]|uniref:cysteine desulfurase n=1 Tax=Acetobacterium paludosum TaxID=52693 RepID=A0A923KW65_9FIRM|nr:aminotransferase class V-fold PLP-dependent enzyme [Acetobacterium paludosum]MBC3888155.1 aminotransferase class V-fold PLP-dependent enzyme [Acetobacterium paludosum]